ncbi:MAG TPA: OmpA family protein [Vicinamibacterales bacterium]
MRWALAVLMVAALASTEQTAWAQDKDTRPATPTFLGDTGLWFVPTAEVVRPKGVSVSVYRTEMDYNQGFTDVSFFPVTAAVGIGTRVEVFGSLRAVTRIDRDMRPLFSPDPESGGVVNGYPFVREPWTGNDIGDLYIGGKFNVTSQSRNAPVAFAVRATFKFPTADADAGAGTGQMDTFWDAVVSKELNNRIELTGYGGLALRGSPDEVNVSDSLRWGFGAGFNTRSSVRFTAELFGEAAFDDVVFQSPRFGTDGSAVPLLSNVGSDVNTLLGVTWQHSNGLMLGAGLTYRFALRGREDVNPAFTGNTGDAIGVQFRVGFHPGVKVYVPPPPPPAPTAKPAPPPPPVVAAPPPPPTPAPPPPNRPPTVTAQCDPCTIPVGGTVNIRATGQDPDGDTLTYVWSAPGGTIGNTRVAATTWRAETAPGAIVVTVTVTDGRGGQAVATTTIQVVPVQAPVLGPILFDFDRSVLTPQALAVLDEAFRFLTANPTRNLRVEGHASGEGTVEYNQALSERRAQAVRDNLQGRGINPARIVGQSFGESRPRNPNDSEANRRLNRRAELFVQ